MKITLRTMALGMLLPLICFESAYAVTISFFDTAADDTVAVMSPDLMRQKTSTCSRTVECITIAGVTPVDNLFAVLGAMAFLTEPPDNTKVSDELVLRIRVIGGQAIVGLLFRSDPDETNGTLPAGFSGVPETGDNATILNGTDSAGNVVNRFQLKDPVTGNVSFVALPGTFVVTATSDLDPQPTPEPNTLLLLGTGMAALLSYRLRHLHSR